MCLHEVDPRLPTEPGPTPTELRKRRRRVPQGVRAGGSGLDLPRRVPSPDWSGRESGGRALKAEDADQFLAALIAGSEDESPSLTTVCRTATRLLHMSGSSVVLMGADTFPSVASAYGVSVTVQDLEFTLGEGPATDAYARGQASPGRRRRVASAAVGRQFTRAIGGRRESGASMPFRCSWEPSSSACSSSTVMQPGSLEGEELSAALLVAELVTNQVLDMQAGAVSESLAWGLEVDDYRAVVHQATGMISAQLDCAMGDALVRLRGRAFAERAADRPGGGRGCHRRPEIRRTVTAPSDRRAGQMGCIYIQEARGTIRADSVGSSVVRTIRELAGCLRLGE